MKDKTKKKTLKCINSYSTLHGMSFKWSQLVANRSFPPPTIGFCAFDLNTKGPVLGAEIFSVHCVELHKDNSNILGAALGPPAPGHHSLTLIDAKQITDVSGETA